MGGITGGLNGVNTCGYTWLYVKVHVESCRHILIQIMPFIYTPVLGNRLTVLTVLTV